MAGDEPELEVEIFPKIIEEEYEGNTADSALRDQDDSEDEFAQGSVDSEDLLNGYSARIPAREIDVDEDTEGDEVTDAGGEEAMTESEVVGAASGALRGDEIELELDETLATGATTAKAPEGD
jgi:hypothetical protein